MSEAHKGKKSPMLGRQLTDEHKQKISASLKGEKNPNFKKLKGKQNPMYGKQHSEEAKQKMREAWLKRKLKMKLESYNVSTLVLF